VSPSPSPSPSPSAPLRQLPARIGQLLVAPGAALARIDLEGGGLRDALWLVALGAVTFRFPQLLEALLGLAVPSAGALGRVLGVLANELQAAAWVVIPAAVIVTALAGARRDASLDLELGAACYVPYFAARALARALDALSAAAGVGSRLPPLAGQLAAAAAALLVLARAVQVARARSGARAGGSAPATDPAASAQPAVTPAAAAPATVAAPAISPAPARPAALRVGLGLLAVALVGLGGNAVWAGRHLETLRPVLPGEAAPGFSLPRADGVPGRLALGELRGQVVVLDFWATWCPPCIAMIPVLHDLHREWAPRGVAFVGVDSDGGEDAAPLVRSFLQAHPAPYPIVIDDGRATALYKVRALPQLVIIGRDGTVRRTFLGYTGRDSIAGALRQAVGP
jgi:thiol-disulfide isomerase/thioredoxin